MVKFMLRVKLLRLGKIYIINRLSMHYVGIKTWRRAGKLRAASSKALNTNLTNGDELDAS